MNPEGHPREFVTMPGFTGQPCAPTVVQYTTVNNMPTELPQDHIVWSLGSFVYFNPFCLGLAALIFSIKARDRKVAGDLVGARSYGATARWINIVSTVLISIIILIIIIVISNYYETGNINKRLLHTMLLHLFQTTVDLPEMNVEGRQAEFVPLQGGGYDMHHGQPSAPAMVQYTTVNIPTDPPKDHIIWSLLSFVYCNPFCLGLAALIFSIKARDRKMAGDLVGAGSYGATARCLNITSNVLVSIIIIIIIIAVSLLIANLPSMNTYLKDIRRYHGNNHYNYYG